MKRSRPEKCGKPSGALSARAGAMVACAILLVSVCAGLFMQAARAADGVRLTGIRTGPWEDRCRVVLDLSGEADYRAWVLTDPDRIVIELPGVSADSVSLPEPKDWMVAAVRLARPAATTTQVVIDLTRTPQYKMLTVPPGDGRSFRIVCDVYRKLAPPKPEEKPQAPPTTTETKAETKPEAKAEAGKPAEKPAAEGAAAKEAAPKKETRAAEEAAAKKETTAAKAPSAKKEATTEKEAAAEGETAVETGRPWVVIIDPGHGGRDPGAMHHQLSEKDLVLDVARRLAERLEREPGVVAYLTRDRDSFLSLQQRVRKAEAAAADIFVSIHVNGCAAGSARGAEVFYLSLQGADDAEVRELAALENQARAEGDDDPLLGEIAELPFGVDLIQNDTLRRSSFLAESILNSLCDGGLAASRGVKQANFVVLRSCRLPSALVELGFLSNAADAKTLGAPDHRQMLSERIAAGVLEFRQRYARHAQEAG